MLIEAFSEAKDPSRPHTNEDRLVILPGRAYAVIDGVTDRLGTRYHGMLSGQYAALIVQGALERMLSAPDPSHDGPAIVRELTRAIEAAYMAHGMGEKVREDWNLRLSAALALVLVRDRTLDVILVGDSGVRLNGTTVLRMEKDLDLITSTLRRQAWPVIGAKVRDRMVQEQLSRRITWHGTRQAADAFEGLLGPEDLARIEQSAIQANVRDLPHVPAPLIEHLVTGGIVNAQGRYQNDASTVLGYPCLDGFPVPESLIRIESFPIETIDTIEIYSDGYFRLGEGFGVASWETAFAEAEREDPSKVILYPSPKGSTESAWADDRTYLGVRLRQAPLAKAP
ncbi:hypothetical protein [Microvirga thermotolerans]|uniref:Protein phosphatase 2C domain-containing protein n=1 Tax=Microvirga thermotolerans TaxID=2651334 RepID=A0A5P9JT60_9HYPH|nr:hypothetical protein [Microvirga thermotolerans]QFU15301.1 hypothetical protein GDR74_03160 [Microvirga thermotolerans]